MNFKNEIKSRTIILTIFLAGIFISVAMLLVGVHSKKEVGIEEYKILSHRKEESALIALKITEAMEDGKVSNLEYRKITDMEDSIESYKRFEVEKIKKTLVENNATNN